MSQLEVSTQDGVAEVTLSNPGRANALSNQTFGVDLPKVLDELAADPAVRVVVLTGAGGAFCAGSELDADGFSGATRESTVDLLRRAHRCVTALREMRVPSIAAIDGVAIGAGLGLAGGCDIRICSPRSRFAAPYVRMGLTPDMGLSHLLPALVGRSNAAELALTGAVVDAATALRMGLVGRVVDDPLDEARRLAAAIAANPPGAVAATRAILGRAGLDETLTDVEPRAFADALLSAEFAEQFAAYRRSLRKDG